MGNTIGRERRNWRVGLDAERLAHPAGPGTRFIGPSVQASPGGRAMLKVLREPCRIIRNLIGKALYCIRVLLGRFPGQALVNGNEPA